jgi:hypothetical protein
VRIFPFYRKNLTLSYALACTHYLCGLRDLIFLIVPPIYLIWGVPAISGITLGEFLLRFLPYWVVMQIAFWHIGRGKASLGGFIIGFGSFPILMESLLTAIDGRKIAFSVTPKRRLHSSLSLLLPYLAALILCIASLTVAAVSGRNRTLVLINAGWMLYIIFMLCGMLWLGIVDHRKQQKGSSGHSSFNDESPAA